MSWDDDRLGQHARIGIGVLALFAVFIVGVALIASRGLGSSETTVEPDEAILSAGTAPSTDRCFDHYAFGLDGDNFRLISDKELAELVDLLEGDDGGCLAEGETLIFVQGLPMVSGVYLSRDGTLALEGWSLEEGAETEPIGRCFIDEDDTFRSKAVDTDSEVFITIDVGRTGEGGFFIAVVREVQSDGNYKLTHSYNPGQPDTVKATFDIWDAQDWTGVATFMPTDDAHTYNERDYQPWTDRDPRDAPNYDFSITVFCK